MDSGRPACILCRGVKIECVNHGDLTVPCRRCDQLHLPCAYSKKRRRLKASEKADLGLVSSGPPSPANTSVSSVSTSSNDPSSRQTSAGPPPLPSWAVTSPSSGSNVRANEAMPSAGSMRFGHEPSQTHSHVGYQPPSSSHMPSSLRGSYNAATIGSSLNSISLSDTRETSEYHETRTRRQPRPNLPATATSESRDWADLEMCTTNVVKPGEKISAHVHTPGTAVQRNMLDDPIVMGYLHEDEGRRMFELFHEFMNTEIALLDKELHTFQYVRDRSPLLFSAILGATAKFFNREMHPQLWGHAQRLISRVVEQGSCSASIIQGLLILVYWKQPNDQSAWIKVGLAVRMGYQLGWHNGWNTPQPTHPTLLRERLDKERTWYCLATFDRTYAGVFNLPATIRAHEVGDMETWISEHDHLDVSNDLRLCCSYQTLQLMEAVQAWRADFRTKSRTHALLQIEQLFENAIQIYTKWCGRGPGLPRGLGEKQKGFLTLVLRHVILLLRFAMLNFVPPTQVEMIASDCIDRATAYVDQLRVVAELGMWPFQQDIASAKMASLCATLLEIYWRVSHSQRPLVLELLEEIRLFCAAVADNDPDAPTAFVGRYIEKLISKIASAEHSAAQGGQPYLLTTRVSPPPPVVQGSPTSSPEKTQRLPYPYNSYPGNQKTQTFSTLGGDFTHPPAPSLSPDNGSHSEYTPQSTPQNSVYGLHSPGSGAIGAGTGSSPSAPEVLHGPIIPAAPTEGLTLGDLSDLLGMTGMLLDANTAEEQYWSSLFASLPPHNELLSQ